MNKCSKQLFIQISVADRVCFFLNIVIIIPTSTDLFFIQLQCLTCVGFFQIGCVHTCILIFGILIVALIYLRPDIFL
jgi:hypothetical protein